MRSRRTKKICSRLAIVEPLEPRVLYSADLWPVDTSGADAAVANVDLPTLAALHANDSITRTMPDPQVSSSQPLSSIEADELGLVLSPISLESDQTVTLLVIDSRVEDQEQLVSDIALASNTTLEVLQLSPDEDGVEQISGKLSSLRNVSAVHIVSHGADGVVELGSSQLNAENLNNYETQLSAWSTSLTADADVLIYGCDLAATEKGTALLQSMATLCECDIAASDNLTGSSSQGGDWTLEYKVGDIETDVIVSQAAQVLWNSSLDISSNLVGHWKLDGTSLDASVTANDGVFFDPSYVPLVGGAAQAAQYDADGVGNRYIEIPDSAVYDFGSNQFSVSFWYNSTALPEVGQRAMLFQQFDGSSGSEIFLDDSGSIHWFIDDGSGYYSANTNAILDGGWHLVTVARDNSNFELYVDAALKAGSIVSFVGSVNPAVPITLGATSAVSDGYEGLQDDFRLYDRSLSPADIQKLYATTLPSDLVEPGYTITVDTTQDYPPTDASTGDTSSVAALLANPGADGLISLREAVVAANSTDGSDTIILPSGNYALSVVGSGENLARTGDLDVTTDITISGSGVANTVINGSMADRLFEVTSSGSLTLTNLTAQGGDSGALDGAGVSTAGILNAVDVIFTGNVASNNDGGAISSSGTTNLDRVSLVNNSANNGGGLNVTAGTATLTNVTVSGNTVVYDGGGLRTKGVGVLDISFSTIASNVATGGAGGGLRAGTGTILLTDSIVADNIAAFKGQDIFGAVSSGGNNVVQDGSGAPGLVSSDIVGVNASLASLSTDALSGQLVHAIDATSSAFNSASGAGPSVDQRGQDRAGLLDVGAYEAEVIGLYPTDLSHGIEINNDGGNDTYLTIQNAPAIFGGLSQITVEHQLAFADIGQQSLLSYSTQSFTDALRVEFINSGLRVTIADIATDFTGYDYAGVLGDAKRHTIAFTWDNVSGDVSLYIDGGLVESKTGIATGLTIDADPAGVGLLGIDSDSIGGGFTTDNNFRGTYYDVRIWDSTLGPTEMALGFFTKSEKNNVPAGLIADWQFEGLTGLSGNEIVDVVSGNNLNVVHATGSGYLPSQSLTDLNVDENSAIGTAVGFIVPHIAGQNSNLIYDQTTNKFYQLSGASITWPQAQAYALATSLNGVPGQLPTVHSQYENDLILQLIGTGNGAWLGGSDATTEGDWRWLDGTGDAEPFWLGDQNGSAQSGLYANWDAAEPGNANTTEDVIEMWPNGKWNNLEATAASHVTLIEWDAAAVLSGFTYTLPDDANGRFSIDPQSGEVSVASGLMLDYENSGIHNLTAEISDAQGNRYQEVFQVAVNPINESPAVSVGSVGSVVEGGTLIIDRTHIDSDDPDDGGVGLVYQITAAPASGQLELSSNPGVVATSFNQLDIDNNRLHYIHDGAELSSDTFSYQLADGGEDDAVSVAGSVNISITAINDSPEVVGTSSSVVPFINEIHYENFSVDTNEAVEIVGSAGIDLTGWSLVHYTGSTGSVVDVDYLSGLLTDDGEGVGTTVVDYPKHGLRNGPGDGLALIDSVGKVVQLLSWEGTFTAIDGAAAGLTSTDIGVSETNASSISTSMQLSDSGWVTGAADTFGSVNVGQDFSLLARTIGSETVFEDSQLQFSSANGNSISVKDPDAASGDLALVLQVSNGVLLFADTASLSNFIGNGTATVTINGTVAAINTALDGMIYQGDSNFNGSETLLLKIDDQGNTGAGNNLTSSAIVSIDVLPVNDSPMIQAIESTALSYIENDVAVSVSSGIDLNDVDNAAMQSATVQISANYMRDEDLLWFFNQNGITGNWNFLSGVLQLTGDATSQEYVTALRSITYSNTSDNPSTLQRIVEFSVNDGEFDSNTVSRGINIVSVNDAPVLSGVITSAIDYTEDDSPTPVLPAVTVSDIDHDFIQSATVEITADYLLEEDQLSFNNTVNISGFWDVNSGKLVLSGADSPSAYQDALRSVTYTNISQNPTERTITVEVSAHDGLNNSTAVSQKISISAVNDDPFMTGSLPSTITVLEDTQAQVDLSQITLEDYDSDNNDLLLTISAGAGTLNGSGVVGVTDNLAGLNSWLATAGSLLYQGPIDGNGVGSDLIDIKITDSGHTGAGGGTTIPLGTISVDIIPVNDKPSGADRTVITNEDQPSVFSANDFSFSDPVESDSFSAVVIVTIPSAGILTLNGSDVIAGSVIGIGDIDNGLLVYTSDLHESGVGLAQFDFQLQDSGGTLNGGENLAAVQTITIDVNSVNDPPSALNRTVVIDEDSNYTLDVLDFGFQDSVDNDHLSHVTVTLLPASGSLTLDSAPLVSGQQVTVADFASQSLVFTPGVDENGSAYASLGYTVTDDGGVANGGQATALQSNSIAFDILPVNDAPVGVDEQITTAEDTDYQLSVADFGFQDVADGDAFSAVRIINMTANGNLVLAGNELTSYTEVSVADITAGNLIYRPVSNISGSPIDTLLFQVRDNGGTVNGGLDTDQTIRSLLVNVMPVNDPPAGASASIVLLEDSVYTFTQSNFGFADPVDNHSLHEIILTSVPSAGVLEHAGVTLTVGATVSSADIDSGRLLFLPSPDMHGANYTGFTFLVRDDGGTGSNGSDVALNPETINIIVESVNDSPFGADGSVTVAEDTAYIFTASDFGFSDPLDSNLFMSLTVTSIPENGLLVGASGVVIASDTIPVTDIDAGLLQFFPAPQANGAAYTGIEFVVIDDGGTERGGSAIDSEPNRLTINVLAVSDAPAGQDTRISIAEDNSYTFDVSDFGFTDIDADNFDLLLIVSLPDNGALYNSNTVVNVDDQVRVSDIVSGSLIYVPDNNLNGVSLDWFDFIVQDDGSIENGGANSDVTARTVTVDVISVNDPPSGSDVTRVIVEDTPTLLSGADFGFIDPFDGDLFQAVRLISAPVSGVLNHSGTAVGAGDVISSADINAGLLVYIPFENVSGKGIDFVQFQVQDDGGILNGGVDFDPASNKLTIDVLSVNDAPTGSDNTIDISENSSHTFTEAEFGFSDSADGDEFSGITIIATPVEGELLVDGTVLISGDFVSVAQISAEKLTYTPAANSSAVFLGLGFTVHDDGGTVRGEDSDPQPRVISFNLEGVNNAPLLIVTGATVDEGSDTEISGDMLNASDVDNSAAELNFSLTEVPQHGQLFLNEVALAMGDEFTLLQLNSEQLRYMHNGSESSVDHFSVSLIDGGENGVLPVAGRFTLNITEVIDPAPQIEDDLLVLEFGSEFNSQQGDLLSSGFSSVLDNDSESDGQVEITLESAPLHGTVVFNSDGTFVYIHNGSAVGADEFSYRVTNEDGIFSIAQVKISIEPPQAAVIPEPGVLEPIIPELNAPDTFPTLVLTPSAAESTEEKEDEEDVVEKVQLEAMLVPEFLTSTADNQKLASESATVEEVVSNTVIEDATETLELLDQLEIVQHKRATEIGFNPQLVEISGLNFEIAFDLQITRDNDVIGNANFINALNQLDSDFEDAESDQSRRYQLGSDSAMGISLSLTAGALTWVLRGGSLLASLMAATPLWNTIDPNRIVDAYEAEKEAEEDSAVEAVFDE